jgi:hypothetical protein
MPADPPSEAPPQREAGFLPIVFAVFWSFFGVRKRGKLAEDSASIKPQHLIVAGVIGALLFVLTLIVIVRIVIANA